MKTVVAFTLPATIVLVVVTAITSAGQLKSSRQYLETETIESFMQTKQQ
jgi:hypothetical protein